MKPKLSARFCAILLCSVCLLASCGIPSANTDYLAWLAAPFAASGTAVIDEISYPVTIARTDQTLTVETTTEAGLTLVFEKDASGIRFTADGASSPIPEGDGGIPALFPLFALDRTALTEVKSDRAGQIPLSLAHFTTEAGTVTVTLHARDLLPTRIVAALGGTELTLTLDSFTPSP